MNTSQLNKYPTIATYEYVCQERELIIRLDVKTFSTSHSVISQYLDRSNMIGQDQIKWLREFLISIPPADKQADRIKSLEGAIKSVELELRSLKLDLEDIKRAK